MCCTFCCSSAITWVTSCKPHCVDSDDTCWQVPKRIYSLEELRLNNVKPEEFLSPEDSTLNNVRTILQVKSGRVDMTRHFEC